MIWRWRRRLWGPPVADLVTLPKAHTHYCPEHDHRWVCEDDPCVRHEAVPCHKTVTWHEEIRVGAHWVISPGPGDSKQVGG
jgi:hypothetical protein